QHGKISHVVAVSVAFTQLETVSRGERPDGARFCLPAHVLACEPTGPAAMEDFQFAGDNFDRTREMLRDRTRDRRERAGDEKDAMALRVVPGKPRDALEKEGRRIRRTRSRPFGHKRFGKSGEIEFVVFDGGTAITQNVFRAAPEPEHQIRAADLFAREKMSQKPPLE